MKFLMKKVAAAAIATGALLAMSTGSASAGLVFKVNPSAIDGSSLTSVTGTNLIGASTELLHLYDNGGGDIGNKTVGQGGFATLDTLKDEAQTRNAHLGFGDGASNAYQLYVTFQLDAKLLTGTNGRPGSTYSLSQLDYQIWADPTNNTSFTLADAATNTEASFSDGGNDKVLLGFGGLLAGTASINPLVGIGLNAINYFALCNGVGTAMIGSTGPIPAANCTSSAGSDYFIDPVPFYDLVFSGFINATASPGYNDQGTLNTNDDVVSIIDATSTITFNRTPEPGSMALIGLGLLGLAGVRRNRKA